MTRNCNIMLPLTPNDLLLTQSNNSMLHTPYPMRSTLCSSRRTATGLHYPIPLHLQNAYSNSHYTVGDFPVSEKVASTILSLPMFPELTYQQRKFVVGRIKEFLSLSFDALRHALCALRRTATGRNNTDYTSVSHPQHFKLVS